MKGEQFAKLFQVDDKQVLITKIFEDDIFSIKQQTSLEEVIPIITLSFNDEEERDFDFDGYNQEVAEDFIKTIENILNIIRL
jgi:hypothetical protein